MAQVTSTIVLPYNLIDRTYEWYFLEIWISISVVLLVSIYLLYHGWKKYEDLENTIPLKIETESIEDSITLLKTTQNGDEFCRITRHIFGLKYGYKLLPGRSILSQKLPSEIRNILLAVEAYEYGKKNFEDVTLEKIRDIVLTHFK